MTAHNAEDQQMDRSEVLLRHLNKEMSGIEIGPFYAPVAPKADGWKTVVIDYANTEQIRSVAANHTSEDVRSRLHLIEPVDDIWPACGLDEIARKYQSNGFDYIIASHVIEHIPDVIEFLRQAAIATNEKGRICLAVPDIRLCFDFFQPFSTTVDALEAYRAGRKLHSPATAFRAIAYPSWVTGMGCWSPRSDRTPTVVGTLQHAYETYVEHCEQEYRQNRNYRDFHCWYFTPSSFELFILELNHIGLIPWSIDFIEKSDGSEFLAHLIKRERLTSEAEMEPHRRALIRQAYDERCSPLPLH